MAQLVPIDDPDDERVADYLRLTDAELRFVRGRTTSGDTLLVRALDELAARRAAEGTREC